MSYEALNGKQLFIVEDDMNNRIVYQIALRKYGVNLEFDRWGQYTLETLVKLPQVDLIVLDLMLPGWINGFDLFKNIRANERFANVPIVAISASDPMDSVPKAQSMGFSGYISKPIDFDKFPEQVLALINGEEVWESDF
jgi:CheY-like chemotaxis protein